MTQENETQTNEELEDQAPETTTAPRKTRKKTTAKKTSRKKAKKAKKGAKPSGKILTFETIQRAKDIKEEELRIPEWANENGEDTIIVRGLTSLAHERLTNSCTEGPIGNRQFNMVGYQSKVAILCSYNGFTKDGGKPIFEKVHLQMLMEKASGPVAAIAAKAHELSGIGKDAVDRFRENLDKTPSADSLFD